MKCDELLAALNEYIDGDLQPSLCAELERHLAHCNPCQVVVDNIRQTIVLYRDGQPIELPAPFQEQLHNALRERWKQTRP